MKRSIYLMAFAAIVTALVLSDASSAFAASAAMHHAPTLFGDTASMFTATAMSVASLRATTAAYERKSDDNAAGLGPEVKAAFGTFKAAFEEFKTANDARLTEIAKKAGSADVLTTEKVDRINAALDGLKADVNTELAKLKRPVLNGADEKGVVKGLAEFKAMAAMTSNPRQFADDAEAADAMAAYKRASQTYLRKGIDGLSETERKEMSVGVAQEGGFLVMADRQSRIIEKIFETTPFRTMASSITVGTNRVTFPVDRDEADSGGWVGEQSTRSESGTPEIGELDISVNEQYAMPYLTQNMIDDSSIDIEAWLDRKVADKMARYENDAFINGTGPSKPRGILSYTNVTTADATRAFGQLQYIASGASGAFVAASAGQADCLISMIYALKPAYRAGARWLAARGTIGTIRKFKDGQYNYMAGPRLADGVFVETLFGFPVVEGEDMPAIAANSYSVAFGNFAEGYTIVDRQGIRQLRDPYTTKGKVKVYTTKRVGGAVTNSDAIKLLKFAAS